MIRIDPYYGRPASESNAILNLYLNMVADVVPFLPEDVLQETGISRDDPSMNPRKRTSNYLELLHSFKILPANEDKSEREQDALLARRLIENYSTELHEFLYKGMVDRSSGKVDQENLRELLILQLSGNPLPEQYDFRPPDEQKTKDDTAKKKAKKSDEEKEESDELKKRKRLLIQEVFRYKQFSEHKSIYRFMGMLNISVCPYCNRQYITTVPNGKKRTRPQLDHFKNKNMYPFLALSITNLIPSCGVCNLLKHDDDKEMLYPYEEGMGSLFVFETMDKKGAFTDLRTGAQRSVDEFEVILRCTNNEDSAAKRAQNSIDELALKDLYQSHKEYITYLYLQRYIHTNNFFEDTVRQFPFLARGKSDSNNLTPLTDEEVKTAVENLKKALFLMDYSEKKWADRPLAKLTSDIATEIEKRST